MTFNWPTSCRSSQLVFKRVKSLRRQLLIVGAIVLLNVTAFAQMPSFGYNNGYQPTQPLPYDHSLHAGKYEIPCLNCHVQADKNRHATVPSLNVCMNCHRNVGVDRPAIQKLSKAYEKGYSIPWLKVHLLPDFVMFNHQPHVEAGVRCQKCHGPIEEMKEVHQQEDLSMGWCVNCHRQEQHNAPLNCTTCHQ